MSETTCTLFAPPACTACDPRLPATPLSLENLPAQPTLRYRVGDFPTFRQSMLDALTLHPVVSHAPNGGAAAQLTSRASDDYAIAIVELWAYVADVLTLYQQAIANEAFLRTAVLRESLQRLAALLGYEPSRGVSATAWLAFFAEKGKTLTLPAGLQAQSVPPPDARPVTFESAAPLTITTARNQPVLLGPPVPAAFVDEGELLRDDGGPPVAIGTKLLFFSTTATRLSEHVVTAVDPTPLARRVRWRGSVGGADVGSTQVARAGRKIGLFGAGLPATYLAPQVSGPAVVFVPTPIDPSVAASNELELDGVYEGFAPNGRVVIQNGAIWVAEFHIDAVSQRRCSLGPLAAPCTVLTLRNQVPAIDARGAVAVFEALGNDLVFRSDRSDVQIPAGSDRLYVAEGSTLTAGVRLLVTDGTHADVVTVTQDAQQRADGAWVALIAPVLAYDYAVSATTLYANVGKATHGETRPEQVLGDGDASVPWQEFRLSLSPVSYLADPAADSGARSTLDVFVDGIRWTEVPTLYGAGPSDPVFVTRVDESGKTIVRFGDGKTSRRPATGSRNFRARVRVGAGGDDNAAAGTVKVLLTTVPGLKGVTNPLAAFGGTPPETVDDLRDSAPTTVVTLGRAVSLRDYEMLALTSKSGVGKARASWTRIGARHGIALTVAAVGGQSVGQVVEPLRRYLDVRRDPNVPLAIRAATEIPFTFAATVHVAEGYRRAVVDAAVGTALGPSDAGTGVLDFARLGFGQSIFPSALIAAVQAVDGVEWVELERFATPSAGHGFGADPNRLDALVIEPGEIAKPVSIDVRLVGGVVEVEDA